MTNFYVVILCPPSFSRWSLHVSPWQDDRPSCHPTYIHLKIWLLRCSDDNNNKTFDGFSMSTFWSADKYHHSWVGCNLWQANSWMGWLELLQKCLKLETIFQCSWSFNAQLSIILIARVSYMYSTLMLESCVLRNETH